MCILCDLGVKSFKGNKEDFEALFPLKSAKVSVGVIERANEIEDIYLCADHLGMALSNFEVTLCQNSNTIESISPRAKQAMTLIKNSGILTYIKVLQDAQSAVIREAGEKSLQSDMFPELFDKYFNKGFEEAMKAPVVTNQPALAIEEELKRKKRDGKTLFPTDIKSHLDDYVVGQEDAKKVLAVSIYDHYKRVNSPKSNLKKSNVLIAGPTGCGKTLLTETCCKLLDLPYAFGDMASMTASGYVGHSLDSIFETLLREADGDVEKAQKGVIFLDEIDKVVLEDNRGYGNSSVKQGVQNELLRILQGGEVTVSVGVDGPFSRKTQVTINTENILFIGAGAFEGLDKIIKERNEVKKSIGFNSVAKVSNSDNRECPTTEDYVKYGVDRQVLGRFAVFTYVNPLTEDDIYKIITTPKDSILKEYKTSFEMEGIKLTVTEDAIRDIATRAFEEKVGARGLRRIFEDIFLPYKYNIGDYAKVGTLVIDKNGECLQALEPTPFQVEA